MNQPGKSKIMYRERQISKFALLLLIASLCSKKADSRRLGHTKVDENLPSQYDFASKEQLLASACAMEYGNGELSASKLSPRLDIMVEFDIFGEENSNYSDKRGGKEKKIKEKKEKDKKKYDKEFKKENENRIIGGTDALKPYNYFTMIFGLSSGRFLWFGCGASLVAPDLIITAAHCVDGLEKNLLIAYVNAYIPGQSGSDRQLRLITERIIHPNYDSTSTPSHDMALLKMHAPVTNYSPVKLPETVSQDLTNESFSIMGFGFTTYPGEGKTPHILQEAEVSFIPNKVCESLYSKADDPNVKIDDSMLCAKGMDYKIDTCEGDSGGPIILKDKDGEDVLVGITSWGYGCAVKGYPGIYSSTAKALPWIYETICAYTKEPDAQKKSYWCNGIPSVPDKNKLPSTSTPGPGPQPSYGSSDTHDYNQH